MVKEMEKTATNLPVKKQPPHRVLVQLSSDDFHQNEDGSWVTMKEIVITGATEKQPLIKNGREFKKGEISLAGLDLATILERHCPE